MPSNTNSKPEDVVRDYLTALRDPKALLPTDAIESARSDLEGTDDPIERLKIRAEIEKLEAPPVDRLREEFVGVAKEWADGVGISGAAFAAEGVANDVLRDAGFTVSGGSTRSAPKRASGKRVSRDDVTAAMKGRFTVSSLEEATGASKATVRAAISDAIDAGDAKELGTDPSHEGPGRAPLLYEAT